MASSPSRNSPTDSSDESKISYYYATRGEEVHPSVERKVARLEEKVRALFSDVGFSFEFVGAARLMTLLRRQPKTTYALRLSETPISSEGAFIGLVGLKHFHEFITDEKGKLRRSLFESNVRDYQGTNPVNDEIQETLRSKASEDFWWLNNGVTILASRPGTLSGDTLTIEDPQVVNGLQTSTEIYKFFQNGDKPSGVTSKPASWGHFKTGQLSASRTTIVLPYRQ